MNKMIIQLMALMLSLTTITTASTRIIIYPTDDSYVSGWDPDLNYGSEDGLYVYDGGTVGYKTYLKFNLSRISDGNTMTSATLVLYCNRALTGAAPVGVHYLHNDNWNESTITWNNAPTNFDSNAVVNLIDSAQQKFWLVTQDVNNAYNEDGTYSVVLKIEPSNSGKWFRFCSKEYSYPVWWPYLEIICEGTKYGGGAGTSEDPYLIYTAEQLSLIGDNYEDWDKNFKLMRDIDLSQYTGIEFHMIGTYEREIPFSGCFDGNGHVISNFTFVLPDDVIFNYIGLFGYVGTGGIIKNLGLERPHIYCDMGNATGSLVGSLSGGLVTRCWARNVDVDGDFRVGGLIGRVYEGTLSDSYVNGGQVLTSSQYAGGLAGATYDLIVRCYCTPFVGGSGSGFGGLVAFNDNVTVNVKNSFWDRETSGRSFSNGGIDKSTAQMQTKSTFTDASWDFVWETVNGPNDVWAICEDVNYPKLVWQYKVGDSDNDKDVDFIDFAAFAGKWMQNDSTLYCGGNDLTGDGFVDLKDLADFVENWLQ
jgi:hypothetical protein